MPNDSANIVRSPVNVYLAPTGADYTDLNQWELVGWCKSGEVRLAGDEKHTIRTGRGVTLELSQKYIFSAQALETTRAQVTALEAFKNTDIDIVLINRADRATGDIFASGTLSLAPDFLYTFKESRKLKFEVTFSVQDFTDFWSELAAATGYS